MTFSKRFSRVAATLGIAATLSACSDTIGVALSPVVDPLFTSYVSLGNSITAGYQSSGINDSTQRQSYAYLLAQQMGTRFAYPSLDDPGCPPPVINFQTQARVGGGDTLTCELRRPEGVTYALNNVAVPGATSFDPISQSTSSSNPLTLFILGGKSQVERALAVNPTFASVWIGNNDVLAPAVSGFLTPVPDVSTGITSQVQFEENYDSMITVLKTAPRLQGGVLIGVVQVAAAPILFPGYTLYSDPVFKNILDEYAGSEILVSPNCIGSSSLISFRIINQMRATTNQHPYTISCEPTPIIGYPGLGSIFVLTAAEQTTLSAAVTAYNNHIQLVANANGWAYFDPNPALQALKTGGCIRTYPDLTMPTQPFGECVSLDGVHPSARAHRELTNALVTVINAKYGTTLAPLAP